MKKYKSIIIAFLLVTIHIIIILVLFKKPSIDQDKINKQNKQSNIEPDFKNYLPDDPQLERLKLLTNKLIENKMLENLRIDSIKAVYNQSGEIQIQITKSP